MAELYQFAGDHPALTWLMAWGVWVIPITVAIPFRWASIMYNRRLRSKNIHARGCPTAHLMDADGEIIHPVSDDN